MVTTDIQCFLGTPKLKGGMPWYLKMRYVCMVFLAARKTMEYKKPQKKPPLSCDGLCINRVCDRIYSRRHLMIIPVNLFRAPHKFASAPSAEQGKFPIQVPHELCCVLFLPVCTP
jgi:hypothetical protein